MEAMFATQRQLQKELSLQKVNVVLNKKYKANGTKSYVSAMRRYGFQATLPGPYKYVNHVHQLGLSGGKLPIGGRARLMRTLIRKEGESSTNEVTAEDEQNDALYLTEVTIGTPPQKLMLDFDTGSSDLWVISSDAKGKASPARAGFESSKSSTFKQEKGKWSIEYGDSSYASGTVGSDMLNIAGINVPNQIFGMATQVSEQFTDMSNFDGMLGLAYSSIDTIKDHGKPAPTPIANMIDGGILPKDAQLFTSCFYSTRDTGKNSFFTIGYIDEDLVKASGKAISFVDIDNSGGFWMFPSTSCSINGTTKTLSGNTAICDTGTTLALLDDDVVSALYDSIEGSKYDSSQQGYLIPEKISIDSLPTFSVAVGDTQFVIQKEDLIFGDAQDGFFYGGVQSRGSNPFDILGDTFLKSVYAIWDQGKNRFGVVPKIEQNQNLGSNAGGNGN